MKAVTFKYRPTRLLNFFLTVRRQVPEDWSEVSEQQFRSFESLQLGEITDLQFICSFFGVRAGIARMATDFLKYSLLDELEFLGDVQGFEAFLFARQYTPAAQQYQSRTSPQNLRSPLNIMIDIENKKRAESEAV